MKRLHTFILAASLAAVAVLTTGCQSSEARVVQSNDELITSVDQIDIQDFENAADVLVQRLLISGQIQGSQQDPAVMAVSRVVNNTQDRFDMDLLTRKVRTALNTSGKVRTTTTIGLDGPEDPLAREQADYQAFVSGGQQQQQALPDYTLSGKIIEVRARAGNQRQSSFIFSLVLTETASGLAVWEGEETITKQGRRNAVGG